MRYVKQKPKTVPACKIIHSTYGMYTMCGKKNSLQFSLSNCNKLKHIFTFFGTHYPEGTFY